MPVILVVDDNQLNRVLLAERLRGRGYSVHQAEDGVEALRMLDEGPYDMVMLDVMMPAMDGLAVLRRIREQHSIAELPVIMVTARGERRDVVEALGIGANDYVVKPLDFAVVAARVATHLALKRANDEIRRLNHDLEQAQERIARLTASASDALRDVTAWSAAAAAELTPVLGAASIRVTMLADGDVPLEDLAALTGKEMIVRGDDTLFAITGLTGDVYGALVVAQKRHWSDGERRLVDSFLRQLGSALELQRTREELSAANARVAARRQEMLDRGVDILQLCPNCGRCYDQQATHCAADGWTLDAPRLLPFRVRGRYRFVRSISSSGMSALFEAHDETLDRAVAVKLIKPEHFNDPAMRVRFEQEARAVARIDHPGVVAVFDSGEVEGGTLFFAMELLRGMNLGQVLRRFGAGAPWQVASLARQLGAAVAAAHRAGFIHRDIKPENIYLIDDDVDGKNGFRVKLLDFGITKPIGGGHNVTQTGTFIGTPAYMAPEQQRGEAIDVRADVYAVGAVLYEALSGGRIAERKALGPDLDRLLAAALAEDPAARPADVESWTVQLAQLLECGDEAAALTWPRPLGVAPPEPVVMSTQRW